MDKIEFYSLSMGADPEFFFKTSNNKVIESGEIIKGSVCSESNDGNNRNAIARDGVQAELHPQPHCCRAYVGNDIHYALKTLNEQLKSSNDNKIKVSFDSMVHLSKSQMDKLDEESKTFGCAPSYNAYNNGEKSLITVNPAVYRYRSAGGHIHIGSYDYNTWIMKYIHDNPVLFVDLLDLICGNTCVLIDRDPGQIERRKVYGKAGEYRLPGYGIEYRTPSNFWLRSYQLMSLVLGLGRLAVIYGLNICLDERKEDPCRAIPKRTKVPVEKSDLREIFNLYSKENVREAINSNDFDLAYRVFFSVKRLLFDVIPDSEEDQSNYPIVKSYLPLFEHFITKPIEYWFKENPMDHWVNLPEGHGIGWESFLTEVVRADMYNSMRKKCIREPYFKKCHKQLTVQSRVTY
jgi:hypothetical protein